MSEQASRELIRGNLLARNMIFNIAGQILPMVVALFAIPQLIRGLGTERFGLLTLIWVTVGYFSLFDLGFGRALTKLVAEKLGAGAEREIPALFWTSTFLVLLLGLIGTLVVSLLSPWLIRDILKIPKALQYETLCSCYILAFSIPIIISSMGFSGFLEAHQRFKLISAVRVSMGIFMFLSPLLVLYFIKNLFAVVAVLVVGRLLAWLAHFMFCLIVMPELIRGIALSRGVIKALIGFGGWITVSNAISPLIFYLDRFIIAALVSTTAVAYYTTPYEVVTRILFISSAIIGVLFPAIATSYVYDSNSTALLFARGTKCVFLILFPITLFTITFAYEGLDLWLGADFAKRSTLIVQLLAIGVFANGLSQAPAALVQGIGRPDLTAKLHLIELPLYLALVVWLIKSLGIEGAAIGWAARTGVEMLLLFAMSQRMLQQKGLQAWRMIIVLVVAAPVFTIAFLHLSIAIKGVFILASLTTFSLATWFQILAPEERIIIQNQFKSGLVFFGNRS